MSSSISRLQAISAASNFKSPATPVNFRESFATELYGTNVFSPAVENALNHGPNGSVEGHARHFQEAVLPAMLEARTAADALEGIVADDLWPLPTYQEMLFIK